LKQAASGKLVLCAGAAWLAGSAVPLAQICILQFDQGPGGMLQTRQAAGAFSVSQKHYTVCWLHRQP